MALFQIDNQSQNMQDYGIMRSFVPLVHVEQVPARRGDIFKLPSYLHVDGQPPNTVFQDVFHVLTDDLDRLRPLLEKGERVDFQVSG
jgi:hypothetical protein